MEKYYLARLELAADLDKPVKLVELQYSRRAPSLGVVYLARKSEEGSTTAAAAVHVASLELGANKETKFGLLDRIQLPVGSTALDFDTNAALQVDGSPGGPPLACILLARDTAAGSSLYSIFPMMVSAAAKQSPLKRINLPQISDNLTQQFTRCRLTQTSDSSSCIHLLSDRSYQSFVVATVNGACQALHTYSISRANNYLRLVNFLIMDSNQEVAILELSDFSLQVVHQSTCLASLDLTQVANSGGHLQQHHHHLRHLLLSGNQGLDELVLVTANQTQLLAHSIRINHEKIREDPDNLLPEKPSFELEQCWSLDLNDLESIRALEASSGARDRQTACCLCPMWSEDQASMQSWPKFLLVAYQFHLLVYTFEQVQTSALPFSVVYDRAFLTQALGQKGGAKQQEQQTVIDAELKPKLVYNFKLIGAQPTDALFNTLFQARNDQLCHLRHFNLLGFLAGLTEAGHLFGFKFKSPRLVQNKDNLYQQLFCDSIRCSSRLLIDQVETLQMELADLKEDIAGLETRSEALMVTGQQRRDLRSLMKAELVQCRDMGGLYKLQISLSNLIQVNQLLVVSTTSSHILSPANLEHIQQIRIDNELSRSSTADGDETVQLLTDGNGEQPIKAYAMIDLEFKYKPIEISLPIFIMDGHRGQLNVFYILNNLSDGSLQARLPASIAAVIHQHRATLDKDDEEKSWQPTVRYHLTSFHIKPLISYQMPASGDSGGGERPTDLVCHLTGPFSAHTLASWLQDCLPTPINVTSSRRLTSPFTHCKLEYSLRDGELNLKSNDLFALEVIKRHILKEATDKSIKLEVKQTTPTEVNLRHSIELQAINFAIANRLRQQSTANRDLHKDRHKIEQVELIIESLFSEVSLSSSQAFPPNFKMPSAELVQETFERDISQLLVQEEKSSKDIEQREYSVFTDLICGFIIDALADFDQMFAGKQRVSADKMMRMRTRILSIMSNQKPATLASSILAEWNKD